MPYVGTGPLSWASITAKLQSETERSLADEAGGPIANLVSIPQDGGDGGEDDTLTSLKADIRTARGKALLLETVAGGWGEGRAAAPQRDWTGQRLGPMPPPGMVAAADAAFQRVLAACGVPPPMFIDADGTSQREALRRWHMNTVLPLAKIIEHELTEKLEAEVKLVFDNYALDMVSRAQVVAKLVSAAWPSASPRMRWAWTGDAMKITVTPSKSFEKLAKAIDDKPARKSAIRGLNESGKSLRRDAPKIITSNVVPRRSQTWA